MRNGSRRHHVCPVSSKRWDDGQVETIWGALIGLVGTVAASLFASESLKRRSRREAIKADLDVWKALPDGKTKDRLLSRIEQRADDLGFAPSETRRRWFAGTVGGYISITTFLVVSFVGGGYSFERHSDSIVWIHTPQGPYLTLADAVLWYIGAPIALGYVMATTWNLGGKKGGTNVADQSKPSDGQQDSLPPPPDQPQP
jgi:hypothetical protein